MLPWRGYVLLFASIAFYAVAGLRDSVLAAAVILVNYAFQFAIMRDRRWLYGALVLNIGCLAYFKYRVFLETAAGFDVFSQHLVIPLGISFYIFQLTAFLIDLSRGRAKPFYSLPRFALFKLFFGQLVAGPIMRWRQFGPQIHRLFDGTLPRRRLLGIALGLCLVGLIKKVVFADALAPFVETIFHNGPADAAAAWLGIFLFSSQVYFDFSGYSDIALGLGYLFGLRLAVNFRQPFAALTPAGFLAPLAHHAELLDPRLPLYAAGPPEALAAVGGLRACRRHGVGRALARRKLDVHRLGRGLGAGHFAVAHGRPSPGAAGRGAMGADLRHLARPAGVFSLERRWRGAEIYRRRCSAAAARARRRCQTTAQAAL